MDSLKLIVALLVLAMFAVCRGKSIEFSNCENLDFFLLFSDRK